MLKKTLKAILSVILVLATCSATCTSAFAASFGKKSYVKEVFLSYGSTDDEAKKYLTDNGYEVLDNNLNEGADDIISKKRSVYLGYKTTDKSDEAITDMKLMNMKGGYSVQDYQMLLDEQKTNIKSFLDNFIISVNEYRNNYKKGQERAVAAHEMLNLLFDDDTQQYMGDLLLNKVKEEYTDEEFAALTQEKQVTVADMTTILMQGNANAVLAIEQLIAGATDDGDSLWTDRYSEAKTYDEMVEELVESKNVTMNEAVKQLSSEYDQDAKAIESKFEEYKSYIEVYTSEGINLESSQEEVEAYEKANKDFDGTSWFTAGTQCETLKILENDGVSLFDLITGNEYDVENEDRYMLYPLVASLTEGQRACLDFLPMYQIVALGINGNDATEKAMKELNLGSVDSLKSSIYDGVDRSIFGNDVALTNEALRLQSSTGKDAMSNWSDSISDTSKILYCVFGASVLATVLSWSLSPLMGKLAEKLRGDSVYYLGRAEFYSSEAEELVFQVAQDEVKETANQYVARSESALYGMGVAKTWQKIFYYSGIAMTCITIVLMGVSLWSTYNDLKEYYNAEFTPIPLHMVNEGINDNDEKVYTYYTAVKCNRVDKKMGTDSTLLLGDYGDLNGDVGRQWVALYTTKDKAAGDPITSNFVVQYNNTNIPNDAVALSMFGESVAQNLTNKKSGYTYSDSKDGIYLFYGTDTSIFAGTVFSNGIYAICGVGAIAICGIAAFIITKGIKKKKNKEEAEADA